MKGINVYITDDAHLKLSELKRSLDKSNLADVIISLIETYYSGSPQLDMRRPVQDQSRKGATNA